jgi:hypothetical protein
MATRMQQRRGTAAQWTDADPILAAGEIGFETDTSKFKVGDGTNNWSDLTYFLSEDVLDGTLDDYILSSTKGQPDGVATLDGAGKIPVAQLGNLIADAPALLDTLEEISAALGDDPDFASKVVPIIKKTTTDWTADSSIIPLGTIAYNTTLLGFKVGNGVNNFDGLEYVMNNAQVIAAIEAATPGILTDATLTGTVELPATTSIGTVTDDEIAHLSGVNGSIQGQLDAIETDVTTIETTLENKADLSNPTFTGTVDLPSTTSIGDVSALEIGYLNGVTSAIQTQLDAKLASATASSTYAPLSGPTFTGTVVLPSTTSVGDVSSTELGYVNGVTSAIQAQLDAKAPTADPTFTGTVSGITSAMVGLGNVDNTSDADKPVSDDTQDALDLKADLAGATFSGDVTIEGNLTIEGTTTTVNAADLEVTDPLIYLAAEQYATDVLDIGFLGAYGVTGGDEEDHLHSGLVRDNSDSKKWKLISNVPHPVNNTVDFTDADFDTLVVGNLEATGVVFSDGTQTKQGVPSITTITAKTDSYTLSNLNERDTIVEISKTSATTLTIPADSSVNYPVGTTLDIIQTNTGQVTIAGAGGVTVNATPGLKLRTRWSSATLLKRAANTWLVYGDLTA